MSPISEEIIEQAVEMYQISGKKKVSSMYSERIHPEMYRASVEESGNECVYYLQRDIATFAMQMIEASEIH